MVTAKDVLGIVEELSKTISSTSDLKVGDSVEFVKGHNLAGIQGIVQDIIHDGTVVIRVGQSVRVGIPVTDIVKVAYAPGVGEPKL